MGLTDKDLQVPQFKAAKVLSLDIDEIARSRVELHQPINQPMKGRAAYQIRGNPGVNILGGLHSELFSHSIRQTSRFSLNSDIPGQEPSRQNELTGSEWSTENRLYAGRKDIEKRASP